MFSVGVLLCKPLHGEEMADSQWVVHDGFTAPCKFAIDDLLKEVE